jgi:hypothetical protein
MMRPVYDEAEVRDGVCHPFPLSHTPGFASTLGLKVELSKLKPSRSKSKPTEVVYEASKK